MAVVTSEVLLSKFQVPLFAPRKPCASCDQPGPHNPPQEHLVSPTVAAIREGARLWPRPPRGNLLAGRLRNVPSNVRHVSRSPHVAFILVKSLVQSCELLRSW